jgi:hypothetical protein
MEEPAYFPREHDPINQTEEWYAYGAPFLGFDGGLQCPVRLDNPHFGARSQHMYDPIPCLSSRSLGMRRSKFRPNTEGIQAMQA